MVGDNMSVKLNTTIPSSLLKKKHNAVAYYRLREANAPKVLYFCHLLSTANITDVLTKPLSSKTFHGLLRQYMYKKPIVHDKNQNISATLVRRLNFVTMSLSMPLDNQFYIGLTTILNSHSICYLGPE